MIFARKINKIPSFYMIFAPKMPELYIIIARRIFFPIFWGRRGEARTPACPPSSTPMPLAITYLQFYVLPVSRLANQL